MELTVWIDTLIREYPGLLESMKANQYPRSFLSAVFGLSAEGVEALPRYLAGFVGVYFLCGLLTLVLRFKKGQKSLSSTANQINNVILTCCSAFFIPLLVLLVKGCKQVLGTVEPFSGEMNDLVRFLGQSLGSIFYPILALAGVGFTVWMPISSFLRYLKVHKLGGLPHGVFDIGTGPFLLSVVLLSAYHGSPALYGLVPAALVLLFVIQRGGYIPAERNVKAETTRGVSK